MTPEGEVKEAIKDECKALGIPVTMPVGGRFGKSGVSDFILNYEGRMLCLETKAGAPHPTALQLEYLKEQYEAGAMVACVGSSSIKRVAGVETAPTAYAWLADKQLEAHVANTYTGMYCVTSVAADDALAITGHGRLYSILATHRMYISKL